MNYRLPAGSGASPRHGLASQRHKRAAQCRRFALSVPAGIPDLARVDRSRCASRTVRRSGETRRRAHSFFIPAGGVRLGIGRIAWGGRVSLGARNSPSLSRRRQPLLEMESGAAMAHATHAATAAAVIHGFAGTKTACLGVVNAELPAPAMPVTNGLDGAQPAMPMKRGGMGRQRSAGALFES
jgi:hypothetical protein